MKRLMITCMILLLCLQAFSGIAVYGAVGDSILIENYTIVPPTQSISEGQKFDISLRFTNKSATSTSAIYAQIDSASSFHGDRTNELKLSDGLSAGDTTSKSITLIYKGTGQDFKFTLSYSSGGTDYTEDKTISISEARPSSSGTPSAPTDTSKYTPRLGTVNGNNIPTIPAGNSLTVTYPVKNNSIYQARSITATLKMTDEAKAPLVLDNFDLRQTIDQINGNETQNISFTIGTLASAPEGLYTLKLSYQFQSAYGDNFDQSETVYIRIKNDVAGPRLVVDNVAVRKGSSETSEYITLDLKLKNISILVARDVKVTLKGLKSGGFTTYNSTDIKYVTKIDGGGSTTVSYQLRVPAEAAAGSNELSVKMDYKDAAGAAYSDENQIFVPIGGGEGSKPSIAFAKISSPQDVLSVNKDFQIALDLKNSGGTAAKNIKVSLATDKELIIKSLSPVYIDKLAADTVKTVAFTLFAADDAATRNYPIAVNIEYEDLAGTKYTASQYIGVYIENGTSKTVPRIIIDKYSLDPATVQAASDFKVKMSFLNTSKTTDVSNIKVTVSSDDGTFTPTDSGNTFYLEGISSKQNVERELTLHVKPDAEQKSYFLTVNFEYEDDKGNPYTAKETMSVRVLQNPRLVTGEISLPPETFAGQPLSIFVDFYNMGKSTLYNMMIKAEGNFQGQNLSYYVGNFEPGRTDSYDTQIIPSAPGELSGNVVFSFEDANGKVTEVRKPFTVNVTEMQQQGPMLDENGMPVDKGMGMPNGMPGGQPAGKTSILLYIIPAVVVIVGIVVFIVLRKRHVRRKEMSLDE